MPPLVSIITPTFNDAGHIHETLQSVQSQTLVDWEHLIIDDGSSDATLSILEAAAVKDLRIHLIRQMENGGPAVARNRGIEAAQGRYIAFLDADDLWFPEKLEKQIDFMQRAGVAFSYTDYVKISETDGIPIGMMRCPGEVARKDLRRYNPIGCSTVVYDREEIGGVRMPLLRKRQDWGLWFTIMDRGYVARNVGEVLTRYRVRKNSVSSNKINALRYTWALYRDVIGMPLPERCYRLMNYALLGTRRYRSARQNLKNATGE